MLSQETQVMQVQVQEWSSHLFIYLFIYLFSFTDITEETTKPK